MFQKLPILIIISLKMAGLIPIFMAEEDEENYQGRERVFRDRPSFVSTRWSVW